MRVKPWGARPPSISVALVVMMMVVVTAVVALMVVVMMVILRHLHAFRRVGIS